MCVFVFVKAKFVPSAEKRRGVPTMWFTFKAAAMKAAEQETKFSNSLRQKGNKNVASYFIAAIQLSAAGVAA